MTRSLLALLVLAAAGYALAAPPPQAGWTDWRGAGRLGFSPDVPTSLPAQLRVVWRRPCLSQGVGGVSATATRIVYSDKSADHLRDIWVCLDAATGKPVWRLEHPAPGKMDYTNSPRAAPVLAGGVAYLLGAFGDLHAVRIETGKRLWRVSLRAISGAATPTWGFCGAPLLVDGLVIAQAGGPTASLVALKAETGALVWKNPGDAPGYGNLVVATLGGRRQIVGHDKASLGGWDIRTGRRLWRLVPPETGDFNVPTPLPLGGRLVVATENNGTRLYGFAADGTIMPTPEALCAEARPGTASPVACAGCVWVSTDMGLFCLDSEQGLRVVWRGEEPPLQEHASLIAGPSTVLATFLGGRMALLPGRPEPGAKPRLLQGLAPTDPNADVAVWSHPALVGNRLYVRNNLEIVCFSVGR